MKFERDKFYYVKTSKVVHPNHSDIELEEIFSDGRAISPWTEAMFPKHFNNLVKSEDTDHDLINLDNGKIIEVRGLSKKKLIGRGAKNWSLVPSCQVGAGRTAESIPSEEQHRQKLLQIDGFILVFNCYGYRNFLFTFLQSEYALDRNLKKSISIGELTDYLRAAENMHAISSNLVELFSTEEKLGCAIDHKELQVPRFYDKI